MLPCMQLEACILSLRGDAETQLQLYALGCFADLNA